MEQKIKILTTKVADIDNRKRLVKFYFASFNNVDNDGDIIRPGALRKTMQESGPQGKDTIRHFLNHDFKQLPLGKIREMGEDQRGAWAVSKIARTKIAEDIYTMYEDGMINSHSFGFMPVNNKFKETDTGYDYFELKMFEASTVTTWAANENTPTIEVKEKKGADLITPSIYESLFVEPQTKALKTKADLTELSKLIDYSLFKI